MTPNKYYKSIFGSHLYGLATPESDTDYRGFWVPPVNDLLTVDIRQKQSSDMFPGETDTVMYRLDEFMRLLLKGNSSLLEILFNPQPEDACFGGVTPLHIIQLRNVFSGKHFYKHFKGFAFAEYQKALCQTRFPKESAKSTHEILTQLTGKLQLKSYERDKIVDLIEEMRPDVELYEVRSTIDKVGPDRRQEMETYGYCRKNAYHSLRLLNEGIQYLQNGSITYPFHPTDQQFFRSIRSGKLSVTSLKSIFELLSRELDAVYASSELPARPNIDRVNQLYQAILAV